MHRAVRRLTRNTPTVLVLAGLGLVLGACAKPTPLPPPELNLEALSNWWQTTPAVELSDYASLRMEMSFKNTSGATMTFLGDAHADGPAGELQFWTSPGVAEPSASFTAFPQGDYAPDEVFGWDVTFDLTTLADTDVAIAFRPMDTVLGTIGPDDAELVDASGTLVR